MKTIIILLLPFCYAVGGRAQTVTTVSVSTSTPIKDALRFCENVGESGWFYSLDYDEQSDSFMMALHPLSPTLEIKITAWVMNNKTELAIRLSETRNMHEGKEYYMRRVKNYVQALTAALDSPQVGEYQQAKELDYPKSSRSSSPRINNNIEKGSGQYPINIAVSYPSGIYEFYQLFRRNQVEAFGLNLKAGEDSIYMLTFTDTSSRNKRMVSNWLRMSQGQGVISYDNQLYFMVQYPYCVPLVKKNDTFSFHIPQSLPNMQAIAFARSQAYTVHDRPGNVEEIGFDVLGDYLMIVRANSVLKRSKKDPRFRDCYIDLDACAIRYF